ncbi:hypothetical protein HDU98_011006 [Podochytrium sp. JEL0797]|nr:hypothetical protein HDU98_011006 [Podochytrium sp. JEL0797]
MNSSPPSLSRFKLTATPLPKTPSPHTHDPNEPQARSGTLISTHSSDSAAKPTTLFIHSQPRTALFNDNNLWQAVNNGNLPQIMRFSAQDLITANGSNLGKRGLAERGSNGETILHVACLNGHKECIRWIVNEFPGLINEGYRKGRYLGETALHLAVVKSEIGDLDIVEFLIEKGAKVNGPLALGTEFKSPYYENRIVANTIRPLVRNKVVEDREKGRGKFYFGQTVLHFAAASSKHKILRHLIENEFDPADLTVSDQYKNNVLHILAYHGYFDEFNYVRERNKAYIKAGRDTIDLMSSRNIDELTPIQLGVARGNADVLELIKEHQWKFGMERTYRIPINELDALLEHEPNSILRETPSSAIELAIMACLEFFNSNEDKDVINHPVIDSLIKWKWALYARSIFVARFITSSAFTVALTIAIALQPPTLLERKQYAGPMNVVRFIAESIAVLLAFFMAFWEARGFGLRYRKPNSFLTTEPFKEFANQLFHYCTGTRSLEKITQWTFTLLTLALPILRFAISPLVADTAAVLSAENIVLGIAAILAYLHLLSFSKGFELTGPLLIIFKRILFNDLLQWFSLYISITLGFSAALFLQMQSVTDKGWSTFQGSIVWLVRFLFNQAVYDDFNSSDSPVFSRIVFIVYSFLSIVLLLNVLIAKLVETFNDVTRDSKRVWKVEFASLVLDIDAHLTTHDKQTYLPYLGWTDSPHPTPATPRYFLYTERITSTSPPQKETVKLIVGSDPQGRRIEFIPFPHESYWSGWSRDFWVTGRVVEKDMGDEWMKTYEEWEVGSVVPFGEGK